MIAVAFFYSRETSLCILSNITVIPNVCKGGGGGTDIRNKNVARLYGLVFKLRHPIPFVKSLT